MKTINWKKLLPRYTGAIELSVKVDQKVLKALNEEKEEEIDEVLDDALAKIESLILSDI